MLSKTMIAQRLKRFEVLSGINYPNAPAVVDIWQERFSKWEDADFIILCKGLEGETKWHILPTLNDANEYITTHRVGAAYRLVK